MALGDYTVGQAPGNNQVNLSQMRSGLNTVLKPGMLGNNVANPMSDVIARGGDAQLGFQNAIANSRMQDLGLQSKMQQLQQQEKQYEMNQQKPGISDFLGLGFSGLGAIKGLDSRDAINSLLKGSSSIPGYDDANNLLAQTLMNLE